LAVGQEAVDAAAQDPQAAQPAHVGLKVHRIQPQLGDIHRKDPGQIVGDLL